MPLTKQNFFQLIAYQLPQKNALLGGGYVRRINVKNNPLLAQPFTMPAP